MYLARTNTGHDITTWEGCAEPLFDLSEEEDEPSRQGTKVLVPKAPEYCPPPMGNIVHIEPITVTENIPELVEEVLKGSPSFFPPKENKRTVKGILLLVAKEWFGRYRLASMTQ